MGVDRPPLAWRPDTFQGKASGRVGGGCRTFLRGEPGALQVQARGMLWVVGDMFAGPGGSPLRIMARPITHARLVEAQCMVVEGSLPDSCHREP